MIPKSASRSNAALSWNSASYGSSSSQANFHAVAIASAAFIFASGILLLRVHQRRYISEEVASKARIFGDFCSLLRSEETLGFGSKKKQASGNVRNDDGAGCCGAASAARTHKQQKRSATVVNNIRADLLLTIALICGAPFIGPNSVCAHSLSNSATRGSWGLSLASSRMISRLRSSERVGTWTSTVTIWSPR